MDPTKCIAALFDLDGVVVDTESQYSIFWDTQGGIYRPDLPGFGSRIKGQTLVQIFDKYFTGETDTQRQLTEALDCFERQMTYHYFPGVVSFLHELRTHGIKTAIVTSSSESKMAHVYRAHPELKDSVDCILTAEQFVRSKPDPDCFLLGAETLGTVPENCVVFEDSFHGLEAGNRAGMTVIGLATTHPEAAIRDKAHVVLRDFNGFTVARLKAIMG